MMYSLRRSLLPLFHVFVDRKIQYGDLAFRFGAGDVIQLQAFQLNMDRAFVIGGKQNLA